MGIISKTLLFIADKNCIVTIPYLHWLVHEGKLFKVEHFDGDIDDDDYLSILITTHADYELHAVIGILAQADRNSIYLYENPTDVSGGTSLTAYNINRTKSDLLCHATFAYDPTIVSTGSVLLINRLFIRSGSSRGSFTLSAINNDREWVFKKNEQYLLRIKNVSGNADQDASAVIEFYEVAA